MPHYLLSVTMPTDTASAQPSDEEAMRRGYARILAVEDEMRAADTFVFGGRLDGPERTRQVGPSRKRLHATDGPYTETKEVLGGFYIIRAADLDAATEWATKVSAAIDGQIEVRPFVDQTTS